MIDDRSVSKTLGSSLIKFVNRAIANLEPSRIGVATTPSLTMRSTLLAVLSTGIATTSTILLVPDNPSQEGALFYPALVMSAGLSTAPVVAAFRYPKALLRGESLVAIAPIYWLCSTCCKAFTRWKTSPPIKSASHFSESESSS